MIDADSHTGLVMTRGIDATTGGLTNDYYFVRLNGYHYPTTGTAFKKMDSKPQTEGQVYITYAKERDEFLVTGLNKGSCVVPADMTSGTSITYETSGLKRAYWVASYNRYYGVTGTNGNLLTSLDGHTWETLPALTQGTALGFVYMPEAGGAWAVGMRSIRRHKAGSLWYNETAAPYTNAIAFAYDDDNDVLCVVESNQAYFTKDLTEWITLPLGVNVNFRELHYYGHGIFAGYEYKGDKIYFLTSFNPLEIEDYYK